MVKGEQLRTALNRWYHLINTGNGEKAKSLKRKLEAFGNIQDPDLSCFYRLLTAWYFLMQHDYDQSSAILNTISPHREKSHWLNYYYYFFRGVNAFYFRNYNEALQFLQEAKPFLRDKPEIEQAEFYYRIASVYFRTHHFSLSIKFATKSLRAFSNKDQSERMADCENLLGLNYMSLEDYDRSMIHLKTALNLCRAAKSDNLLKWVIYQNLGLLYAHKGEYDRARTFYEEVYRCIDTKYEWIQLQNIHELCETYFLLNEADKGKALLAEGLRKANDPSNDYFHRFKVLEAKFAAR
ncbi:MAG TPA: tetratricopeptide repeat protein, partial [Bacillales bacterium]|nr:tetratricopeptide repeat protein [Bacillales bacterium]